MRLYDDFCIDSVSSISPQKNNLLPIHTQDRSANQILKTIINAKWMLI